MKSSGILRYTTHSKRLAGRERLCYTPPKFDVPIGK
jgi:hypothetical protein